MKLKLFVYGKLKTGQSKAWMIPFSKGKPYTLYNFKMFMRPGGAAGMKRGRPDDFVIGEIKEVKWTIWPLNKLLLWFLDLNEGTSINMYKRILICQSCRYFCNNCFWTYLFEQSTKDCNIIREWNIKRS